MLGEVGSNFPVLGYPSIYKKTYSQSQNKEILNPAFSIKGWERPVHGPRLEQKTGLPDSYTIAKTEVSNWHAAQQIV